MSKDQPIPQHKDRLGRPIVMDCYVAYPSHNSMEFGRVVKINPKMIKVQKVPAGRWKGESLKYPNDLLIVEDAAMTWYLLKNSG